MRFCFFREYLVIFFLLICLFFVEPFPNLKPFPNPSLKGWEMRAFASPSPSGEGWGEAPASGEGRGEANSRKRGVTC